MTEDDLSFLPLRVTRVGAGGKRSFDPTDKRRLVEACLRPGASLSGLALKAGVNANQPHKWVQTREQCRPPVRHDLPVASSAFVPVVAIDEPTALLAPASHRATGAESSCVSPRSTRVARLSAQLPNGVKLELECSADDVAIVNAVVAALGAR
ncbi:IS66-like element accessory protein TnpA [Paraburkholderia sp. Cpub6]|uniref:IS66-like element accessory protein TnpA n=1 Tax=Paraburkholderia sp. Cpub6 TaxID=2723094 RepID=UPI00161D26BA|nr:transposase [Paraburkholderia sp. Cpub6]MBB5463638.1 transposase [Paraburkholderia sp. Cpub6]